MKRLVRFGLLSIAIGGAFASGLGLGGARAAPLQASAALQAFALKVKTVREDVDATNKAVQEATAARDWNAWWRTHDAYVVRLRRAEDEIERASGALFAETLAGGGTLDRATFEAVDLAATEAANYERHRVIVWAYAYLARNAVPPERRGEALALLARQGVYQPSAGAAGTEIAPRPGPDLLDAPMTGRVPGSPEAADYLSRWQTAAMQAGASAQRVAGLERDLATTPAASPVRPLVEERLKAARAQYGVSVREAQGWREKYFRAGGR